MDEEIRTTAESFEAEALPIRREVHTDAQQQSVVHFPEGLTAEDIKKKSPAEWAYDRLVLYIQNFEAQLDNKHEVAMGFAGSDAGVLRIEGMGFFEPDLVTFFGGDETGAKMQLVQHVTQLSVILRALPRPKDAVAQDEEPRRIGFRLAGST